MAGFENIRAWADSATDDGKNWISTFRKVPAVTTIAGQWFDYSGAAGNPVPNYFASSPLTAAVLDGDKGIYPGPNVSPARKFVHRVTAMSGAASATGTTNQNQPMFLCDYLLYYPFIDMDAAGEDQGLDNTVTLPRFSDGAGVRMTLIAQAATIGGGQFTVTYTNSEGVAGRVTPNHFCAAAQPTGAFVQATSNAAGVQPFISLASGDSGVRSVQSINFSIANGGLAVLLLCKPMATLYVAEECRRTTSGNVESFGSPVERESIVGRPGAAEIKDGAFLSFIAQGVAGTLAASQLVGTLETVWR